LWVEPVPKKGFMSKGGGEDSKIPRQRKTNVIFCQDRPCNRKRGSPVAPNNSRPCQQMVVWAIHIPQRAQTTRKTTKRKKSTQSEMGNEKEGRMH